MGSSLVLKLILLFFMGLVPVVFGLLPLKLYMCLTRRNKGQMSRTSAIIISLISCFCGGVMLGVCLLHLLPETKEAAEHLAEKTGWNLHYPYVELFTGLGLFIVYFVEELIGTFFGLKHDHSDEGTKEAFEHIEDGTDEKKLSSETGSDDSQRPVTPTTASTVVLDPVNEEELKKTHRKAVINAITFVLALVVHTSLEGFAFGVQDTAISVVSLFVAIISHKALVSFSVGMSLAKALSHNKKVVVILIVLLALFSPIGGLIGIAVKSAGPESIGKTVTTLILNCFSNGTFLYIAFFEILAPERMNNHPKLPQWLACILGFLSMAGFMAFSGEHHHDES